MGDEQIQLDGWNIMKSFGLHVSKKKLEMMVSGKDKGGKENTRLEGEALKMVKNSKLKFQKMERQQSF